MSPPAAGLQPFDRRVTHVVRSQPCSGFGFGQADFDSSVEIVDLAAFKASGPKQDASASSMTALSI
jgi:hypothetical protein